MEYGIFGLLILIADIYAIYLTLTSGASTAAKVGWTIAILLLPVVGLILWFFFGPKTPSRSPNAI